MDAAVSKAELTKLFYILPSGKSAFLAIRNIVYKYVGMKLQEKLGIFFTTFKEFQLFTTGSIANAF